MVLIFIVQPTCFCGNAGIVCDDWFCFRQITMVHFKFMLPSRDLISGLWSENLEVHLYVSECATIIVHVTEIDETDGALFWWTMDYMGDLLN